MPKPKHPLRQLRAATPFGTQAAFAAFIGVPVGVLQALESGRGRLTSKLAARVRELTGADEIELLRGAGGAAATLSGRRYTAEDFAAWQGSAAQTEDRARRVAQEQAWREGWQKLACDAAAPSDALVPWQTCEFGSAEARAWKEMTPAQQRLTGWSAELSLPPRTRLTLAVQAAPPWNPEAPPPGLAAANAELFPPCYFTVAAGSGGCRMANTFWRAVCREHAVNSSDGQPIHDSPTGNWRGFFRSQSGRCEPHAVFTGLEPGEAGDLESGLFSGGGILCGRAGEDMAQATLSFIEAHSEDAGSPAGIFLFASLEGGTASALGSLLLERLRERFPSAPVMIIAVLPVSGVSPVVGAPLHIALAMQAIRRHAGAALLFSTDQLHGQARKFWGIDSPGYDEANLLISECLAALTAPLRFGGTDAPPVDLTEIIACLQAGDAGRLPVITGHCWPITVLADRRLKTITLPWLMQRTLRAATSLTREAAAVMLCLRVHLLAGGEFIISDDPPAIDLSGRIGPGLHESASGFAPSPVIGSLLRRLARQAHEVMATQNAAELCRDLGVTEATVRSAISDMTC